MRWRVVLASLLLATAVACSDGRQTVRGIVIEVEGGITEIDGFLLRTAGGETIRLRPADGILFHDNAPIGHLRDHLRSGEEIEVEYEILDDGSAVAYEVRD